MNHKLILLFSFFLIGTGVFAQTQIKKIKPSDTDPLIATFNADSHYVYFNPAVNAQQILVVHLPGSFGEPKRATLFGTLSANLGFHSIGLMYPNVPTVGSFCTNSTDANCFEDVRREIVEGVDYSTEISIAAEESILSRTRKLLLFLKSNYPSENWGQYLDANNNLNYPKIIFSGHSQGGGHAALIAKYYPIKRAICFSSPKDWRNITDAPPLWLSNGNWQTPRNAIYCFNHILDEHTNHQLQIWDSLGLNEYGNPVNVDSFFAPYSNTRQLTTSYNVTSGDEHACTIQDNKTPNVSGVPVFMPVWTYMLTNHLTSGLSDDLSDDNFKVQLIPNPTHDFVTLEWTSEDHFVKIVDQTGKCVFEQVFRETTNHINLTDLNSGVYFIQVLDDKKTYSGKIIKQ